MGLIGICFSRTRPINWSNKYSNSTHYLRASATVVSSNKGQNDFVPKFFNESPADESHKSLQMKGSISAISDLLLILIIIILFYVTELRNLLDDQQKNISNIFLLF